MVYGVILARRGSRRILHKNKRLIGGFPLVVWTLEAASHSKALNRIVTSSDDEEILEMAGPYGIAIRRPAELAGDRTPDGPCLLHALDRARAGAEDLVVHLRPTAPFRTAAQIDDVVNLLTRTGADAVVSVRPVCDHPAKCYVQGGTHLLPATGRSALGESSQSLPPAWAAAGFIDACRIGSLRATGRLDGGAWVEPWPVPTEHTTDLDTEEDWQRAEVLALERGWRPGEIM